MLQLILRDLNISNYFMADLREEVRFLRRIGDRKEQQEARPLKVSFIYLSSKEKIMESAKYLSKIPELRHISINNDLTEMQRKEENRLWREACEQNMAPTIEMQKKRLVAKVVGPRGKKRIILVPLRRGEEVDKEGRVRLRARRRRREGTESREQEQTSWASRCAPISGANLEPLGDREKEQGNGQGAAAGRSRREEQERTRMGQLRRGQDERAGWRFQSSASGEEEGRRKEKGWSAPNKSLTDFPGARMFPVGREEGGRRRDVKTTQPPFRSNSTMMQQKVGMPAASLRPAWPRQK